MAFANLPPNLQDMFNNLQDQINKLLTGPNAAMYAAQSAQSTAQGAQSAASNAQAQAIQAAIEANLAMSQATIAQSQATIASTQATQAQVTADGKNKVYYSTTTPGSTANNAGDIWYQYGTSGTYANKVIAQWSGAGGTSWTSVTVSGLIIANIDAGTITTGVLNAIEINAGSGGTAFHVSPGGYMSAQGVYVKGNITADSGTFNGTLYSAAGYFGTSPNYWQIGSMGLTGVGNATITAGYITGTTITGGTIQTASSGKRVVITSAGNIEFYSSLAGSTQGYVYGGTFTISGNSAAILQIYSPSVSGSTQSGIMLYSYLSGGSSVYGMYMNGDVDFNNAANVSGELRAVYGANNTVTSAANVWISTTGQIRKTTASSERYKTDIVNLVDIPELDPKMLHALPVRAFRYKNEFLSETDDRYDTLIPGFIAEEVDAIYPQAADYENGNVESWNHRTLIPAMLALIQDQEKRIKLLEGK